MSFKRLSLGECITLCIDHRGKTPKKLGGDWSESGYRAFSAKNIKTGAIVQLDAIRYVDERMYEKWMTDEIERGDILVTSEAPFGQVYIWDSDEKIVLSQRLFGVRPNRDICDPHYLYYWMCGQQFQGDMRGRATGTTVIGLRQPALLSCEVLLPDLDIQKKIASLLRCVDLKIITNKQANDCLASIQQGLYCEWTRDGDLISIGDVASVIDCLHSKKPERQTEGKPLIQLNNIIDDGILDMHEAFFISEADYDNWISRCEIQPGDCVITNVGRIGAVSQAPRGTKAAMGRNMTCIRPHAYPATLITALCSRAMRQEIERRTDSGTIMNALNVRNIPKLEFMFPTESKRDQLEQQLRSIQDQREILKEESRSLARLRDTLLPKFMSGEIDVSQIELPTLSNNHLKSFRQ